MNQLENPNPHGRSGLAAVMVWGMAPLVALAVRFDVAVYYALIVLVMSLTVTLFVHIIRDLVPQGWLLAYVMVFSAFLVTLAEIALQIFAPHLLAAFGIFLPILAVSPLVMVSVELAEADSSLGERLGYAAALMGRFVLLMVGLALVREILASGSLTLNAPAPNRLQLVIPGLVDVPAGFLASSAGGLILSGLALALRNWFHDRKASRAAPADGQTEAGV